MIATNSCIGFDRIISLEYDSSRVDKTHHEMVVKRVSILLLCQKRLYSSFTSSCVKKQLNDLYKKVHPDLFTSHGFDSARQTNENSFKIFRDYLQAAEEGSSSSSSLFATSPRTYRIEFYLKGQKKCTDKDDDDDDDDVVSLASNVDDLERVLMTLPPPVRQQPHEVLRSLNKLFAACGIEEAKINNLSKRNFDNLSSFIPMATEMIHQSRLKMTHHHHSIAAIATVFHMNHRIRLNLGSCKHNLSEGERAEAAIRLYKLFDNNLLGDILSSLANLQIGIGDKSYIDSSGRIWLDFRATDQDWVSFFETADLNICHLRRKKALEISDLERKVAIILGVKKVSADGDAHTLTEEYVKFLNRVSNAEFPSRGFEKSAGGFPNVTIIVKCSENMKAEDASRVDYAVLPVVVTASPALVWKFLLEHGPGLQKIGDAQAKEEAKVIALRAQVEKRLQLRQLSKDSNITNSEFKRGCVRLLENSMQLIPLLGGLKICLASANDVDTKNSCINIYWNFHV